MNTIILKSDSQKRYCRTMIDEAPADGSVTVEIKKTAMDSTAKQRRLQWLWYTEVANSGLGQDDDKAAVHIRAKWQFARPIWLRDDEVFGIIYNEFIKTITGSVTYSEFCRDFAKRWISTESMARKQRAEYLTEFQRYWIGKGVELTDPSLQGVDLSKF